MVLFTTLDFRVANPTQLRMSHLEIAEVQPVMESDYENRNSTRKKELTREILLSFWKVHILHHAAREPVIGQWMIRELQHHGYDISPGTLYPVLARMEKRGWLSSESDPTGGLRARRGYILTPVGRDILLQVREQLIELHREVILEEEDMHK